MSSSGKQLRPYQFKKGQSGNPSGGKAHNKEIKLIKRLTNIEVAELGALILQKNITALRDIAEDAKNNPDSKHSSLKSIMAMIAVKAFAKGDAHSLDAILNRTAGKVPDKIHLTGKDGGPIRSAATDMTPEDRKAALAQLRLQLDETDEEAVESSPSSIGFDEPLEPISEDDDLGF